MNSETNTITSGMVEPGKYRLPCIATRDIVLFPNMTLHFDIARERSLNALNNAMKADRRIFLTAQKDIRVEEPTRSDVYNIGVVAQIKQVVKSDDRNVTRVFVEGICRGELEEMYVIDGDALECTTKLLPTYEKTQAEGEEITALMREVKRLFKSYTERVPRMPRELIVSVHTASDAQMLFENVAYNIFIPTPERQALLEAATVDDKLELLAAILGKEIEVMSIEKEIQDRVAVHFDKIQKEAYLREQLRIISDELGESYDELDELGEDDKYYNEILALGLGEEHQEKLLSELRRMRKMPPTSQEAALISEYLDTCIALPWHNASDETYDVVKAQKILDKDHYGLTKVKERILETIAVKQLSPEVRGQIICLYGPPGVGKTSIGKSIAKALGRKYVRVSLGGVNDEADVRGHRKTYIGAMPGRILDAIKRSGVNNPVMLLDEIDKLTSNTRGDPAAALLEALDSEQNKEFRDHYVEIPFDLSRVMFITTANELDTIPAPLLDRMEVIELSSYTREEKLNIAKKHLVPKQLRENGLKASQVKFTQSAIYKLIDSYTKEAGVRKLERQIASLCRKAAAKIVRGEAEKISFTEKNIKDFLGPEKIKPEVMAGRQEIGVVNGLAWTSAGGVLMPLEAIVLDGKGKVEATGSLGDVMKESATIAVSYCRSVAKQYGIDPEFYSKKDIHIHAPEGAVPKDGPSAGVTLVTALVSVLSGRPVRGDVAMTGEITLTGRVLPIGGLREKTMAAYKNGIKTVIIPMANKPDLDEVDEKVLEGMEFVFAERISDVLEKALVSQKGK